MLFLFRFQKERNEGKGNLRKEYGLVVLTGQKCGKTRSNKHVMEVVHVRFSVEASQISDPHDKAHVFSYTAATRSLSDIVPVLNACAQAYCACTAGLTICNSLPGGAGQTTHLSALRGAC